MSPTDGAKQRAARRAAEYVEDGMRIEPRDRQHRHHQHYRDQPRHDEHPLGGDIHSDECIDLVVNLH